MVWKADVLVLDLVVGCPFCYAKGSRKNRFAVLAHRFAADLVSPRERNRRRSPSYIEDFAIEERQTDAVKMGCKNVKLFLSEP